MLTDHQLLELNGQNIVGMKDKQITDIIKNAQDMITITVVPTSIYEHMIKKYVFNLKYLLPIFLIIVVYNVSSNLKIIKNHEVWFFTNLLCF